VQTHGVDGEFLVPPGKVSRLPYTGRRLFDRKLRGTLVVNRRCGDFHMMRNTLLVLMLGVWAVPTMAQQPSAAEGEKLLTEKKCTVCHLLNGAGNKKGPVLDGVGAKLSKDDIRAWITNAPEMAAKANIDRKPPMKAYTDLTKDEVDSLVAYLVTLKKK
jgi:mono/diheme cytochrome c family protein